MAPRVPRNPVAGDSATPPDGAVPNRRVVRNPPTRIFKAQLGLRFFLRSDETAVRAVLIASAMRRQALQ